MLAIFIKVYRDNVVNIKPSYMSKLVFACLFTITKKNYYLFCCEENVH